MKKLLMMLIVFILGIVSCSKEEAQPKICVIRSHQDTNYFGNNWESSHYYSWRCYENPEECDDFEGYERANTYQMWHDEEDDAGYSSCEVWCDEVWPEISEEYESDTQIRCFVD